LGDGVRPDFITYSIAKEYVKQFKPKVLYIGFDETDDYAHEGKYDQYLYSAQMIDKWIADLWNYIERQPQYKNKTALMITTDHGRGDKIKKEWTSHGTKISDASEMWIGMMGPGIEAKG
jgi:bisphosphoglycerate-independent phosphoglycerate mutase (AlkP superfamily)